MIQLVTRRSPLAPLFKGGKYRGINVKKGNLGRSQIVNKPIVFGGLLLLATLITTPANAHKIETQKDVGATIHLEPNDAPRAGETTLTWFALTQKGGKIIPLNECNCKLSIYSQTSAEKPIQPPLKAVSQENYQGIPAADITFPTAGAYQLQLQGSPKAGATFSPFELKFDVNVAPGVTPPKTPDRIATQIAPQTQEEQTTPPWLIPAAAIGLIFTGAIAYLVWRNLHRKD